MRDGTRVVRAGLPAFAQGEPFLPEPTFANPYHLAGDPSSSPYSYGRYHNPTWTHFEQALSELEGGRAVIFASGMAAVGFGIVPKKRTKRTVYHRYMLDMADGTEYSSWRSRSSSGLPQCSESPEALAD